MEGFFFFGGQSVSQSVTLAKKKKAREKRLMDRRRRVEPSRKIRRLESLQLGQDCIMQQQQQLLTNIRAEKFSPFVTSAMVGVRALRQCGRRETLSLFYSGPQKFANASSNKSSAERFMIKKKLPSVESDFAIPSFFGLGLNCNG